MPTDYCTYPPQIAADVEITPQREGDRQSFIVGSVSIGRFILLRETEHKVLRLLDEAHTPATVCAEFSQQHAATLSLTTLTRFLTKLDEMGILAGARTHRAAPDDPQASARFYYRVPLFNPDRLFARIVTPLDWLWTPSFAWSSLGLMLFVAALALLNLPEVVSYGGVMMRDHYIAILVASILIGITHEFAHGLTCKAFGGRVTEVGVLMIFYVLPGLYCNVSGLHLIPQRNRRLWVILAGVYWQVLVGTVALLAWFLLVPYTLLSDVAFIVFLGGVVDVIFNANPLIKLDGYYFLSQWLRLPNLLDRSRAYWRGLLKRLLGGEPNAAAVKWSQRERVIYGVYGLVSFVYSVSLRVVILYIAGNYLMDSFHLLGLFLTVGLALIYARHWLKQLWTAAAQRIARVRQMDTNQKTKPARRLRRLIPLTIALLIILVLLLPWRASVGNYGTLVALPGQEAIIHAPESATLTTLRTQPGEQVVAGAIIGQMGNFDLDEQIVQSQAELARTQADYDRLLGELRIHNEAVARAGLQLRQRQHDYDEIHAEQQQIQSQRQTKPGVEAVKIVATNWAPETSSYPPALAALQTEVDLRRAQLEEATTQRTRARQLTAQGILPRSELDTAETRARTLALEMNAARERLAAALIDHQRKHTYTATEMQVARTERDAASAQTERLAGELQSARALLTTLAERRDLLQRKHAQFVLTTPRAGAIFGEELPRMTGRFFQKGEEICRVADTRQLLLRVQVPEREIGDVRLRQPVRLKVRSFPDRTFFGAVSKIGGESELDENRQATYRVELTIENNEGVLRPGMTAFARIEFNHQMIGQTLWHKLKQALRPELWML
ncbi:MAG: efflux RND transporter periplasmic adaptor subunit [Blastocatellia bacterium]